jgi:short-subunit dehydrogenase
LQPLIGASSELGREIAILFSKLGAKLVLNSRNKEGLEETVKKCEYSDIESVNEY